MQAAIRDTVVLHDYFGIRGGGERVALNLAAALDAALVYGYRLDQSYGAEMFPPDSRDLGLHPMLRNAGLRALSLAPLFARYRDTAKPFRNRFFSGVAAPFAAPEPDARSRNIYYCHTPPRFIYDLADHYAGQRRLAMLAAAPALALYRRGFEQAICRMDAIVANSQTVAQRIKSFLGREAAVVYPPCDTSLYQWREAEGYFLSTARLTPLKRVDRVIEAFLQLPRHNLVITSDGEDRRKLAALARNAPNIRFTGPTSDAQMRSLIGGSIATIYVARDEDFGMSPIESMASGKPVIGVAEGGLLETLVPGETGELLASGFSNRRSGRGRHADDPGSGRRHARRRRSPRRAILPASLHSGHESADVALNITMAAACLER